MTTPEPTSAPRLITVTVQLAPDDAAALARATFVGRFLRDQLAERVLKRVQTAAEQALREAGR